MNNKTCTICFEQIEEEANPIITISCGHTYHNQCIRNWYINIGIRECPYCRKKYDHVKNVDCEGDKYLHGFNIRTHNSGLCIWDNTNYGGKNQNIMNDCPLVGYPELGNLCIQHAYSNLVYRFTFEQNKYAHDILSSMTELNKKCSQTSKNGKPCKLLRKYIRGGVNYCTRHFVDNGEPFVSVNNQCEYNKKLYVNGNVRQCKKKICMTSGSLKMCKYHLPYYLKEDYYEKNHEMIDQEIEKLFSFNEQMNQSFSLHTNESCHWYHPFTYKRCKSQRIYMNDNTYYINCKKHTYKLAYIDQDD